MSKQLYEEALADVKKLKEVAEDNAKRALLDAVTPRIKDLIENQLIGESKNEPLAHDEGDDSKNKILHGSAAEGADHDPSVEADLDELDSSDSLDEDGDETLTELNMEAARALGLTIDGRDLFTVRLKKLGEEVRQVTETHRLVRESKTYGDFVFSLVSEVKDMYSELQRSTIPTSRKKQYESVLESHYSTLKSKLAEYKMINRRRNLTEAELTLKLDLPGLKDEDTDDLLRDANVTIVSGVEGTDTGDEGTDTGDEGDEEDEFDFGDEDEEEGDDEDEEEGDEAEVGDDDEIDLDLSDDEGNDEGNDEDLNESRLSRGNTIVEIDENMLRREIFMMRQLREAAKSTHEMPTQGHGGKDPHEHLDEDDEKINEIEHALDEVAPPEEDLDEADDVNEYGGNYGGPLDQSNGQSRQPGATVESIHRQMRRELRIQMEAKRKAGMAQKAAASAQGLKEKKSRKKKKKLSDVAHMQRVNKSLNQLKEAYSFHARRYNASVARVNRLRGLLSEATRKGSIPNGAPARSAGETSHLRGKLAETNLFNTKLLFTNKLLQNESLTKRQKAAVIERLDEARSEREVKLVYESLVRTLQDRPSGRLNESADRGVMGSSSRPARPASTALNEGFETERWARLAGIVK